MPTIQIDTEANALVLEQVSKEKQSATLAGKPTKRISKNKVVSDLIKRALPPPSKQKPPKNSR
jgi:hypothetical protein